MKRILIAAIISAAFATPPALAANVGISVSVGQPGFYGQIDIGNYSPPQLIYRQPIIIERGMMQRPPVYLRVPRGHARNWRRYCQRYNACDEQVYFVQDGWYQREYVPRYQQQRRDHDEQKEGYRNDRGGNHHGNDHENKDRGGKDNGRD